MMTLQLTGLDEREKRKKRASTDRRGLHSRQGQWLTVCTVCKKTKVEHGKQLFPHCCIVPPLAMWPSHIWPISPLYSFILQLPSPFHCVWCQLDKFSFFFSPFISNLCRTMSTVILPSPPPLLLPTQAIPHCCHHQPPSLPHQHPATSPIP